MSDLYNDNRSTTISGVNGEYVTESKKDTEKWFQEFREFDYGIDIKENIILIKMKLCRD